MPPWLSATVAFATGAAVLIVELMAVRLMAPWFGQSQLVWTHVIGVVLAALAAGQWIGGRWAEARRGGALAGLLLASGALSFAIPDLLPVLAAWTLPPDLTLEEAYPFVTLGSLLVALCVLGAPLFAAGAVAPWLVRLSREAEVAPGRAAGRVLAAGTIGSLAGTFGSSYLLLEALGSAGAVRVAGGALLAVGGLVALGARTRRAAAAWLVVPALAFALPAPERDARVLAAVETPYQHARVEETADGTRLLRLNEGLDSFHSAYRPGELLTGMYFDAFLLPVLCAPAGADGTRRALVIGLAGGTMARQAAVVAPDLAVTGVEIDPELVALARRWFALPEETEVVSGVDGRLVLERDPRRWGAILLDAYASQIYLPAHLCTDAFFARVRARLVPGGVAALNLGGRSRQDPVVAAVAGTFARHFPVAEMAWVPGTRNMLLLGWDAGRPAASAIRARLEAAGLLDALGWLADETRFAPVAPTPDPLRDGDAPVEALAHRAWRGSS